MLIFFGSESVLGRPDASLLRLSIPGWKCVRTTPQDRPCLWGARDASPQESHKGTEWHPQGIVAHGWWW